jgi:outer membrane protein OmpA-like peptidoglycan-associated protein
MVAATVFFLAALVAPSLLGAQKLFFSFEKGDKYLVEKFQKVTIKRDRQIIHRQEKNRISLAVTAKKQERFFLKGQFITYQRPNNRRSYQFIKEDPTRFVLQRNGYYKVAPQLKMPNIRSVPVFPHTSLTSGETWKRRGEHTIYFLKQSYKVSFPVSYSYLGSKKLPKYAFYHPFLQKNQKASVQGSYPVVRYQYNFRQKGSGANALCITGKSQNIMWFDTERGIPLFAKHKVSYRFAPLNGSAPVFFHFNIFSWYTKIPAPKRNIQKGLAHKARQDFKDDTGIAIEQRDEGIQLTLKDILFQSDSTQLTNKAQKQLQKIARILKQYPQRELRILGHTDNTGDPEYNLKLSQKRARRVLHNLKKHGLKQSRMSYKGYGEKRPLADNKTPKGRAQNRRVEILIVNE